MRPNGDKKVLQQQESHHKHKISHRGPWVISLNTFETLPLKDAQILIG